ncbi:MAG: SLC26A/SulP transporter family protein [Verrucomicrobiales bacterium]|nr:SLC26A/SulP transporter family protein [Verrucomicrobiales bacterium]
MVSAIGRPASSTSHALMHDGLAGAVIACFTVFLSLSFGSLIFSGELASGSAQGVVIALITAVLAGALVALRSSYPAFIAIPQDRTAPILALLAAEIAAGLPAGTSAEVKVQVVLGVIAVTTLMTGLVLYLVGRYRLGNLFRFIPYPVVGGFLAGSGWLLATGAFRVMLGFSVTASSVPRLVEDGMPAKWIPGIVFGALLLLGIRRFRRPWIVPGLLVGSVAIFYAWIFLSGGTVLQARQMGWLPPAPPPGGFHVHAWSLSAIGLLSKGALIKGGSIAATVLLTALISILLNTSALELVVHEEIDTNRELAAAGLGNLVGGIAGGMPGFHSLSLSRLAFDLGGRSRRTGLLVAALCGVALIAGPEPLSYVPRFVPGGLLFYLGLGFLMEWGFDAASRLPRADYGVVLLILCVVGAVGYLEGVAVGIVAAVFLFVHNYSRVGVYTHSHTGADHQSNVERPMTHQRLLRLRGEETQVLRLHGFMFFGTSARVLDQIRRRSSDSSLPPLRFFLLDFRQVSGIDSSATLSLSRARQLAEKQGFVLGLCRVSASVREQLNRSGFTADAGAAYRFFKDLDHGLEWCEEQILSIHRNEISDRTDLRSQLEALWPRPERVARLMAYLEPRQCEPGTFLIRQGDAADALYFLESGEVTTCLELANGHTQRLRRQGSGTVLGELGLFLGVPRTASVVVETPSVVHRLSAESLDRLKHEEPEVSADFHEFLVRYMAERIVTCNKTIRALAE